MSDKEKISFELPSKMVKILQSAVASGDYSNSSEVVCEAIQDWKINREFEALDVESLREMAEEGINSGEGVEGNEVFTRLKDKYSRLASKNV